MAVNTEIKAAFKSVISEMIKILFLGDIVGKSGRTAVSKTLSALVSEFQADVVIANGENSAGGLGIDLKCAKEIFAAGVDLITSGNHIWKKKEICNLLDSENPKIIRPANYPPGAPGSGVMYWNSEKGWSLRVINVMGRIFIPEILDCPFQSVNQILSQSSGADITLVDFHAEATSEKIAMGYHLDGRAQAVVGTHTHVQTADERILPKGTAYITDVGMCGPSEGVIGVDAELIVKRFNDGMPSKFALAKGQSVINAVLLEIGDEDFKSKNISRIQRVVA